MKLRHLIMTAGLLISAGLASFGDRTPSNQVVDAVTRKLPANSSNQAPVAHLNAVSNSSTFKTSNSHTEPVIDELLPRVDVVHATSTEGSLFGSQNWTPPAPPPVPPPPPPPPSAPAIPFSYAGKRLIDGAWEVFLTRGDTMIYAHNNGTIDSTYRIDSITPPTLNMTYLPLNQKQTINIGEAE